MARIVLIAPAYLPSRRANSFQVMKTAAALAELGHEVQVLAPRPDGSHTDDEDISTRWSDLGEHYGIRTAFEIEWLPSGSTWRGYDFGWRAAGWAIDQEADLVLARHPQAAAAASLRGIPSVLEIHDYPHGSAGPWLLRLFLSGRGARRLVAVSRALLGDLARDFRIPPPPFAIVEPDGVDLERYADLPSPSAARAALGFPERFTAGYTGHLYPGRGVETILALASRLPEVQFLIVGGREADLERVRAAAAGSNNVNLTGFIPNAYLPNYQAACDVLLMPYGEKISASSGGDIAPYLSPMKLFEYLASGRAVMSSDLPVLREVLDDRIAVLLPPGDVSAWAAALESLIADPDRRRMLGEAARAEAAEYSWLSRARRILGGLG